MKNNKKYLVADVLFSKTLSNDKNILDISEIKIDVNKASKEEFKNLFFDNIHDIDDRSSKKYDFVECIMLSPKFDKESKVNFSKIFPRLKTIVCQTRVLYDIYKEKYDNLEVVFKEPSVNYC